MAFNFPVGSANKPKPKEAPKHAEPDGDEQPMPEAAPEAQGGNDTAQAQQEFSQVMDAVSSGQQPDPEMVHQLVQYLSQFLPGGGNA